MEKAVELKKQYMMEIKPGAISFGEPKFIWIKMITKPHFCKFETQKEKFNTVLEDLLSTRRHTYIMNFDGGLNSGSFSRYNNLTATGRVAYWSEVDRLAKLFDKQELSLKPRPVLSEVTNSAPRMKLPKPPPRNTQHSTDADDDTNASRKQQRGKEKQENRRQKYDKHNDCY